MNRLVLAAALVSYLACSSSNPPTPPAAQPVALTALTPAVAAGTVRTETFASASLGVDKSYVIYLPAGYDARPDVRWPVFYYLHGLGGNEHDWTHGGELDKAADRLGLPAIVVMPDGDDSFYIDAVAPIDYERCMSKAEGMFMPGHEPKRTSCVKKRAYDTYITKDLVEHIDSTYRTIATREGRAIAGLSMGGFGALSLAMRHTDLFSAAASHSGVVSLIFNGPVPYQKGHVEVLTDPKQSGSPYPEITSWMRGLFGEDPAHWRELDPTTLVAALPPGKLALYIDCGTEDSFALENHAKWLHDLLLDRKIDHAFFLGPGSHDFKFWKARVPESLAFLRDHTSAPRPASVSSGSAAN